MSLALTLLWPDVWTPAWRWTLRSLRRASYLLPSPPGHLARPPSAPWLDARALQVFSFLIPNPSLPFPHSWSYCGLCAPPGCGLVSSCPFLTELTLTSLRDRTRAFSAWNPHSKDADSYPHGSIGRPSPQNGLSRPHHLVFLLPPAPPASDPHGLTFLTLPQACGG